MSIIERIQGLFNAIDFDRNGVIDCYEVICVLNKNGLPHDDVTKIITRLDINKDGFVNFDEFYHLFSSVDLADLPALINLEKIFRIKKSEEQPINKGNLRILFEKIDTDNNGIVEFTEFLSALDNYSIPRNQLSDLMRISQEKNGSLSLKDFDIIL
jgi:Ca2+-binding EF-hand superfamily protein